MKNKLIYFLLTAALIPIAYADVHYFGIGGGLQTLAREGDLSLSPNSQNMQAQSNSAISNVNFLNFIAGRQFNGSKPWISAIELNGEWGRTKSSTSIQNQVTPSQQINVNTSQTYRGNYGINFMPGYQWNSEKSPTNVYIDLGLVRGQFETNYTEDIMNNGISQASSLHHNQWVYGFRYGVSSESWLKENLYMRADLVQTRYASWKSRDPATQLVATEKPVVTEVLAAFIWKFGSEKANGEK